MFSVLSRRSTSLVSKHAVRSVSVWSAVPAGPPDPILGTSKGGNFITTLFTLTEQVLLRLSEQIRTLARSTWESVPTEMTKASPTFCQVSKR